MYISGNGLVKYVDLQVLGVWDRWSTTGGHIDLSSSQLDVWRRLVQSGQALAGRPVPVVIFHDWGFGDPPFPWMAVLPGEQAVWMRTRGAEIYAAGGFFAFPVHGPFKCDAGAEGTLPVIAHLTEFYQRRRDIYLHNQWLGSESVSSDDSYVSLAATWLPATKTVVVHVVNRDAHDGVLASHGPIDIGFSSLHGLLSAQLRSHPILRGEHPVTTRGWLTARCILTCPLYAYSVILLHYDRSPDLHALRSPARAYPVLSWNGPSANEFPVLADGTVEDAPELGGFLQGMLHREMRNPPTFLVDAGKEASIAVHVRAVATAGARLQISIDGSPVQTINLPDKDGKNDSSAPEYDATYSCPIPPGKHRVTVDNVGGDWATIDWYEFKRMDGAR